MIRVATDFSNELVIYMNILAIGLGATTSQWYMPFNEWFVPLIVSFVFILITTTAHLYNVIEKIVQKENVKKVLTDYWRFNKRDMSEPIVVIVLFSYFFFLLGFLMEILYVWISA